MSSTVALVTGSSSGIGRALALRLAREGYSVGLAARREDALQAVKEEIEAGGGEARALACDVTDPEAMHRAARACQEALGPVDLLVANAGVSEGTDTHRLVAEDVERLIRVNFLGAVYAVEAVLPGMLERKRGHLVAVSSLAGFGGLPKTAAYAASKAALRVFFESLRLDLKDDPVDVTVISPGYVRASEMSKYVAKRPFLVELDDAVERMYGAIAARRPSLLFPVPLSSAVWAGQALPRGLYDRLAARIRRDRRE